MVSNIDKTGLDVTFHYECSGKPQDKKWLNAYLDSGGVWTIGIGTIRYPNGKAVKKGDVITPEQVTEYFLYEIRNKVDRVNFYTRDDITQANFNALVDLSYNIGTTALQLSTLLKVVNNDPKNPLIINRFCDWRFDNGKEEKGLLRRRMSNAFMYFTGLVKTDWVNYKTLTAKTIAEVISEIKQTQNIKIGC